MNSIEREKLLSVRREMKQRCYNPNHSAYKNYGGRGIKICDEWLNDYNSFLKWAENNGYREGLSIDRIDNDGHPIALKTANSRIELLKQTINGIIILLHIKVKLNL